MKVPRVFLGLSLPTVSAGPRESDAVIDFWEGGSFLYGFDLMGSCADYLPLLSPHDERTCLEKLCDKVAEIDLEEEVIGNIGDIGSKLFIELDTIQRNWFLSGPSKGFLPSSGWCHCYRRLLTDLDTRKLMGLGIASIDIEDHRIVTYLRRDTLEAEEIISTMPLPYVLKKAGYQVSDADFPHEPLHISLFLVKGSLTKEPKKYVLAKLRYGGIAVYVIPDRPSEEVTSIYHASSAKRLKYSGLQERALSDIKRLGLITSLNDVVAERHIIVRYGLLGKMSKDGVDASEDAGRRGLIMLGRLGRWREMSVCESYLDGLSYSVRTH